MLIFAYRQFRHFKGNEPLFLLGFFYAKGAMQNALGFGVRDDEPYATGIRALALGTDPSNRPTIPWTNDPDESSPRPPSRTSKVPHYLLEHTNTHNPCYYLPR